MICMIVVSILTAIQVAYARMKKGLRIKDMAIAGVVGLVLGEALDFILGYKMGLWSYVYEPYWTTIYWVILPVMWTEFGIGVYIAWKLIRPRLLVIPMMMVAYETYGIIRHGWHYSVPWWVVMLGWIPLILTIVMLTNAVRLVREREKKELSVRVLLDA